MFTDFYFELLNSEVFVREDQFSPSKFGWRTGAAKAGVPRV